MRKGHRRTQSQTLALQHYNENASYQTTKIQQKQLIPYLLVKSSAKIQEKVLHVQMLHDQQNMPKPEMFIFGKEQKRGKNVEVKQKRNQVLKCIHEKKEDLDFKKPGQAPTIQDRTKSPSPKLSAMSQKYDQQDRAPFVQSKNRGKKEPQVPLGSGMLKGNKSDIFKNLNYTSIKALRQIKKTICPK